MDRKLFATEIAAGTDARARKAWLTPQSTAIDAVGAEAGIGINPDGPYPPS